MIIELKLSLTENKTLFAAWEIPEKLWQLKSNYLIEFMETILRTEDIYYIKTNSNENILYSINCKPNSFYQAQNTFDQYSKNLDSNIITIGY